MNCRQHFLVYVLSLFSFTLIGQTFPSVPGEIIYQGRITDAEKGILNGEYEFMFSIYDEATDGQRLWSETHPIVIIADGIYNVRLGEYNPIDFSALNVQNRYLEVRIGDETLSPRQMISSVPFALKAEGEVPEGGIILGEESGDTAITGLGYTQQGDTIGLYYLYKKNAYNPSQPVAPQRFAYQGRLLPFDGDTIGNEADFIFTIYDADTAGSILWTETHEDVPLSDGLFNVELGANNPIYPTYLLQKDLWLNMNVNGEELQPRIKIGSVAYAFKTESPVPGGGIVLSSESDNPDLIAKKFTSIGSSIEGYYLYKKDIFSADDTSVPLLINYQGRLKDETGVALSGDTIDFNFQLYDSPSEGNTLWSETVTGVSISDGIYELFLGSGSTITPETFISPEAFLEVKVIQGSTSETLSPRHRMTSVPFALQAEGTMPTSAIILGDTVDDPNLINSGFQMSGDTIKGYYVYTKKDVDKIPPELTIVQPEDGITTETLINIHITYSDELSGIDLDTLVVYHNTVDITSSLTVGDTCATGSVTGFEGGNVFNVWISDNAGNMQFDSSLVLIELGSPPVITIMSPQDAETLYTNTPLFRIEYYDTGSGVNLNTLAILLDGATVTDSFDISSGLAQWQTTLSDALSNGLHTISAQIQDFFGNLSLPESHSFEVSFSGENPNIISMDPDFTIPGDTVTITGTNFSDTVEVFFTGTMGLVDADTILSHTPTQITARVPGSAISGNVLVVNFIGSSTFGILSDPVSFTLGLPYAYITNRGNNIIAVMDYRDNQIISSVTIPGSPKPWAIDITPDGRYAFVANYSTHNVTVINTLNNSIVNTVPLRCGGSNTKNPRGISISPDGSRAFVANDNRFISEIEIRKALDGDTCSAVNNRHYLDGNKFYDIDFTPNGERAVVAARGDPGYVLGIDSRRYCHTDANTNTHYLDHTVLQLGYDISAQTEPMGVGMLPQRIQSTSPDNPWWSIIVNNGLTSDPVEHSVLLTLPDISHRDTIRTDPPGFPSDTCTQGKDAIVSDMGERAFITFSTSANIGVTGLLEATTSSVNDVLAATEKSGSGNDTGCPCPAGTSDCMLNKLVYTPYLDKVIATVFWATQANSKIMILDADTNSIPINYQDEIKPSHYMCISDSSIYQPEGIAVWPHFDRDGDKISDLVEARNVGGILRADDTTDYLNPVEADTVTSEARDQPTNGIVGGFSLPEEGIGYRHFYGEDDVNYDCWGTLKLVQIIEQVGREWNLKHPEGPRISIGDMSTRRGGRFRPHSTHQQGLDVDIRYVLDGDTNSEGRLNFCRGYPYCDEATVTDYDQTQTQELINLFIEFGASLIYVDPGASIPAGDVVVIDGDTSATSCGTRNDDLRRCDNKDRGHSDHIHIRIRWP